MPGPTEEVPPQMALKNRARDEVAIGDAERLPRVGALEVEADDAFQHREWLVQRVGWAVIALVVVAALLGVFGGHGPLNERVVRSGPLAVQVDRVVRHGGDLNLAVEVDAGAFAGERLEIWFDRDWWDGMSLRADPMPEAESTRVAGDVVVYAFAAEPGSAQRVEFTLRPNAMGRRHGRAGLVGGPSVSFRQLVLP